MYSNTGYLPDSIVAAGANEPLTVDCCGCYRLITRPVLRTWRPTGCDSYQIIYINNGQAWFDKSMDGKGLVVGSGTMVAYRPHEPQSYVYTADYQTDACWVHFLGTEAEELLRYTGFTDTDQGIMRVGTDVEFRRLYDSMIREIQLRREGFQQLLACQLRSLGIRIHRRMVENHLPHGTETTVMVQDAILYFNEHFSESISITDYVRKLHMSESMFTNLFKQAIGIPPKRYITSLRMHNARNLLIDTDYPINEIAFMVGYDNPLYFSRIYSKYEGVSPSRQREMGVQPFAVATMPNP